MLLVGLNPDLPVDNELIHEEIAALFGEVPHSQYRYPIPQI